MNTYIRGSLMIYNTSRSGSVKDAGEREDKTIPDTSERSGKATDQEPHAERRFYGAGKRDRIISNEGKLELVAD